MSTLNKVMLIGNLGDDVKMHYFDGGNCVGRFPIATSETYVSKQSGERITNTEWHNIVVRNKAAELCEKYLKKGDKIYVEGRIKSRQWQSEDGTTRYSTEIQVQDFTFLTPKQEANTQKPNIKSQPNISASQNQNNNVVDDDDDLPF